jgi:hypothetical protein
MGHPRGAEKLSGSGVAIAGDLAFWMPVVGVCLVVGMQQHPLWKRLSRIFE